MARKNNNSDQNVLIVVIVAALFLIFFGGFGMMNFGGMGHMIGDYGYNIGFFGGFNSILVTIIFILIIVFLIKKIQKA